MNEELNHYLVGVYAKGKTKNISVDFLVGTLNKDKAIDEAKRLLEEQGLIYGGWNYCDWAD